MSDVQMRIRLSPTEAGTLYQSHGRLQKERDALKAQVAELEHELALIMNDFHLYPWCCKDAERSNGWNHAGKCKNWVLVE